MNEILLRKLDGLIKARNRAVSTMIYNIKTSDPDNASLIAILDHQISILSEVWAEWYQKTAEPAEEK